MADTSHHHQHRPHRLSVPSRTTSFATILRSYPSFRYSSSSTPTPTPSKHRLSSLTFNSKPSSKSKSSLSFLFLLLFSLRSLYSLLPFLRSSPSFSLFPFSFLVSLLSFFLTLSFSLFSSNSSSNDPFHHNKNKHAFFAFSSITPSQQRILVAKSVLLALVFLLRFQALRYCGTASMILAEFMGSVAARFVSEPPINKISNRNNKVRGFVSLFLGLCMLSFGWDRIECFPLSKSGKSVFPNENCMRIWPLLLPFMSGFLACYERVSIDWGTVKQLGHKRVRVITLFFTTIVLYVPAMVNFFVFESIEEDRVSFGNLAWPLANTVVFGVLLSENYSDDSLVSFKDCEREFLVTFVCTLVLELFYFPDLSLWGLLLCGLLLYVAVRDLDPFHSSGYGSGEESSELFSDMVMKPIRHILSERKSRKIALFLLINAGYMVVEFAAGFMSNSLGLISDACHMLFDCAALAIGLYASYISRLPANNHYNYGRGRFEVLSGYANAVFLVLVGALIVVESFERILDPQEISTSSLLVVSIGGLVVNVIGLIFFHEEHHHAHGLSGSCSHSHSHSEFHSHNSHHHHERHVSNQEVISVSGDYKNNSCSSDPGSHDRKGECHADNHSFQRFEYAHAQKHDHHDHASHHDYCSHEKNSHADYDSIQSVKHLDHVQQHDHHDHVHHHDHPDHVHHHGHHDHVHHHGHHDHVHHHGHHDHASHQRHNDYHDEHDHHDDASHHKHGDYHDENDCQHHHHHHEADHRHDVQHQGHSHRHVDHNMEGIFLHVLADTMGSVGVVISTLLIKYKGWLVADPACSIFISILIISSVIPLLRNSAEILLQRVPRANEHEMKDALTNVLKMKGIYGIQKFHLWSFTTTDVVGTLHLHLSPDTDKTSVKSQVSHLLHNAGIKDLTLQVECVG